MMMMASQIQPPRPAGTFSRLIRKPSPRWTAVEVAREPVGVSSVLLFRTVLTLHTFQLAALLVLAPKALEEQGKSKADEYENDGDDACRAHEVGPETPQVHVQGQDPRGVSRTAAGEDEDQVEVRQRSDHHQGGRGNDGVLQLGERDVEELLNCSRSVDLRRFVERLGNLAHATLVDEGMERHELPGNHEDHQTQGKVRDAKPVLGQ